MEPLLHRSVNSAFPGLISFWTAFLSRNRSVWTSRRRLFDAVWNEIGSYAPDEVVIVGDSLTSDIRGGKNAGILTCWYNPDHLPNKIEVTPDCTIDNLQDILLYLDESR